jgi:hypothetical protein
VFARTIGGSPYPLRQTRRLSASAGILLILSLAIAPGVAAANLLALGALAALALATATGWLELSVQRRLREHARDGLADQRTRSWRVVLLLVGGSLIAAAQSWFQGSTVIAAGDETLPNGTVWTGHLFDAWVWSGSNLGGPGALQLQLPWALILRVVTALGGSAGLAQRLWLTILFAGVGIAGVIIVRNLGLHPIGGVAGGLMYAFNPFTLSSGGGNVVPVVLATQIAIALLASIVFAVARERISIVRGALLIASSAPLLGFIFQTPPQLGIAIVAIPLAIATTWWLWGRGAAVLSLKAVGIGIPLLLVLSAYWIIPATLQTRTAATELLSGINSWQFTEIRATLGNAFWLNTHWTWFYPQYVPYASNYTHFPLNIVIYAIPAGLMSTLLFRRSSLGIGSSHRAEGLALTLPLVSVALLIIFLSTGTEFPSGPVFMALYALPFGWLLREPGRFLVVNALIYSLLAAVLVTQLAWHHQTIRKHASGTVGHAMGVARGWLAGQNRRVVVSTGVLSALAVLSSYPLVTGDVIPDTRAQLLPPAHVNYPQYWDDMASYLNSSAPTAGAVLVLPLDDFYQMPYGFGFYGSDSFITNLVDRHVLLPVPQGYFHGTPGLASTVALVATDLRDRAWTDAANLMSLLGVSYVLVRGDIVPFPGRAIDLPQNYSTLTSDPLLTPDRKFGPLTLFATNVPAQIGTRTVNSFWTVDTGTPDAHLLGYLPSGVHLVAHAPIQGVPSLELQTQGPALIDTGLGFTGTLAVPALDCEASTTHGSQVTANVIRTGGPQGMSYLELTSTSGIACVAQRIPWKNGPLLVELTARHRLGDLPHVCLLEEELARCSAAPELAATDLWSTYRATVFPDPGTKTLTLYLTAGGGNSLSINDYANVRVTSLAVNLPVTSHPLPVVNGEPTLTISEDGFSDGWTGPPGGEHVLVDGLFNGWITATEPAKPIPVYYTYGALVNAGYGVTLSTLILLMLVSLTTGAYRRLTIKSMAPPSDHARASGTPQVDDA